MKTTRTPQSWVTPIILFLGLAALLFKGLSYVPTAADYFTSSLQKALSPPSFCTEEVGEGVCCELRLEAEPCLNQCRKDFTDRQAFQPTKEYDECAEECLVVYQVTCNQPKTEVEPQDTRPAKRVSNRRRARRQPLHLVGTSTT